MKTSSIMIYKMILRILTITTFLSFIAISCKQKNLKDSDKSPKILELFTLGEKFDPEILQSPKLYHTIFNYTDPKLIQMLNHFGEKTYKDIWFYLLYGKGLWVKCDFDTLGNGILTGVTLAALVGDVKDDNPFYTYNIREDASSILYRLYQTKYGTDFETIVEDTSEANIVNRLNNDVAFDSRFGHEADADNEVLQGLNQGIRETIMWDLGSYKISISTKKYFNKEKRLDTISRTIIQYKLKDEVIKKIKQSIDSNNMRSSLPKI
jgi:hypothetical protein